ncbi:MAG: lipoprotein-releasing ABC transporter permease subunit [Steroidobacteraceae bacterium]|nr:lipoprotein-releasing ABC transporter permease subunit [Steroidobacteraceae bacterium]
MFHPLALYVGLRYVRPRSQAYFVSFIAWVAVLGVAVGVAALIVVVSVMNGFENDLRERLLALTAHARFVPQQPAIDPQLLPRLQQQLRAQPGVVAVAPYVEVPALVAAAAQAQPVQLRGIEPRAEQGLSRLEASLTAGRLRDLDSDPNAIVLGVLLARKLGVEVGAAVTVLVPAVDIHGVPQPRVREFIVRGLLEVGVQETDSGVAVVSFAAALGMAGNDARASGVYVRFDDALRAPQRLQALAPLLPAGIAARAWSDDHANYFRAVRIEKTMMSLILLLIVAIAAFNLVAMLVMVVNDKRADIAILRTFGTTPGHIARIFLTQGIVIGWLGVLVGVIAGSALAANVTPVAAALERWFGVQIMNPEVFYITSIPTDVRFANVVSIALVALVLTAIAVLYPARRAASVAPAEALRYE